MSLKIHRVTMMMPTPNDDWVEVEGYASHENLSDLSESGFYNTKRNTEALTVCEGDTKAAIRWLMNQERNTPRTPSPPLSVTRRRKITTSSS